MLPDKNVTGKGGAYNGKWYKEFWIPDHPNANKNHRITEHRYLAAKALGKPIPVMCVVHHHNGTFRGGFLVICQDSAYHKLLHVRMRAYKETGDPHKRKCSFCKEWDDPEDMMKAVNKAQNRNNTFFHSACSNEYMRNYRKQKRLLGLKAV